ncbi:hypothetical protein RJ639_034312 [Escallonia herrerae]|uniref:Uncharacterized protein n=1 Tax=Escallonia herrerae TaxID=1293975 RepID=A0AA89BEY9_9ASTE|nr:hypothetical protein RJ639_034312 [Escallonia herrerae]
MVSLSSVSPVIHGSLQRPPSGYIKTLDSSHFAARNLHKKGILRRNRGLRVNAVTEGSAKKSSKSEQEEQPVPIWAKPDSDEPPPWARDEAQQGSSSEFEVPFYAYLLASAITAIAAVSFPHPSFLCFLSQYVCACAFICLNIGSVFEYLNQRPVFGVLNSDSIFYVPVLGFFAFTGIPTSAFLWFKSVQAANKEAEEQDKRDGYR